MPNSYRTILRSSAIMGGSSVVNVLVGLARMKVAALVLGPAGVGLIGLLQNLMGTAAGLSALGLSSAGTRQLAAAAANERAGDIASARRALFWGSLFLAATGGLVFFLLRDTLAARVLNDPGRAREVGWLALGVVLTVAAGSQRALLNGFRRIGDLARLQIASGVCSAVVGILVLLAWGKGGMVFFIIIAPLASFVLGHWYVAQLGHLRQAPTPLHMLAGQWRAMVRLGSAFMVSTLAVSLGQLVVRSVIQHRLGAEPLGQFQAAWAISMTYLSFVLSAMMTDYYPRLTAVVHDRKEASRVVNEQTEVALLLGGPAVIALMAVAPLIVELLYSHEFAAAADVLRWQLLGDVLKIASWPLSIVLLASGSGRALLASEGTAVSVFVAGTWLGMPHIQIQAAGVSFLLMYVAYLPLVYWLARPRIDFSWRPAVKRQIAIIGVAALSIMLLAHVTELGAALAGCAVSIALGVYGLGRLGTMAELGGRIGRLAALSRRAGAAMGLRFG
jgi:PST family polysaccharide transporter